MNVLRKSWRILKMISSYFLFWPIPENLYIMKGNYFFDLGWYDRAIKNYEKASRDSTSPRLHARLGYCYAKTGNAKKAVEYYRKTHHRTNDHGITVGLAFSEYDAGNMDESEAIIQELRRSDNLEPSVKQTLENLEARIALVRRERDNLKKEYE
jgi:tetratricopeptide (TPR) repeat protein